MTSPTKNDNPTPSTTNSSGRRATLLPWPALLALGAATLVMVTAEMLPTAVLVPMSEGLDVSESRTGQLVAAWALTIVVSSLPLSRLTRRTDRRALIIGGLLFLAMSSLATATASSYGVVFAARLAGAAAVGLLWASANAHVADLVPEELLGRAIAVVLGGATFGMVLGTPFARLVADLAGWRAAFAVVAGAAVTAAILVQVTVPGRPRTPDAESPPTNSGRAPLAPALLLTGFVGILLVGFYGSYTFITRLGEPAAGLVPGGMSALLLGFGIASAFGVATAGRVTDHATWLGAAAFAISAALLALHWAGHAWIGLATIIVLGFVSGALPPLAQTEILRRAGAVHRDLAAALIPVVFNAGIAVGAAAASQLVAHGGSSSLPVPAALTVTVAAAGLWATRGHETA